ncbi:MAG: hypothetical protein K9G49_15810 [Taibaiella sp.]|nr:hypothetical protein [Taibaiella sp.]
MKKWDKLNGKLDEVLNRLTKEDWEKWDAGRRGGDEIRRHEILEKSIVQAGIISIAWRYKLCENNVEMSSVYYRYHESEICLINTHAGDSVWEPPPPPSENYRTIIDDSVSPSHFFLLLSHHDCSN